MPRLMSVALTVPQVRDRSKTVTRRDGWLMLRPGDPLTLCEKTRGRKPGEPLVRIADVTVVSVRREPLNAITAEDVAAEGFPQMSPAEFVSFFTRTHNGCEPAALVTRIEWRYADQPGGAPVLLRLAAGEGQQGTWCAWDASGGLRPPEACGEPAVCTVTDWCAHGHGRVFGARACARHAATTLDDGPGCCGQCAEAGRDGRTVTVITAGGTIALAAEGDGA